MKRQPYTKAELDALALKMENRLGIQYFYSPVPKVNVEKVIEAHSDECRCDQCVRAYLVAMDARLAKNSEDIQVTFEQVPVVEEIINFIG
jgi:hypothetical protein